MRLYPRLVLIFLVLIGTAFPSNAEKGSVRVVFAKAAFVAGIGGGNGVLTFRGKRYPFDVSGLTWGATAGISTNQLRVQERQWRLVAAGCVKFGVELSASYADVKVNMR